ncbi:hypothetical protein [Embleya sp. NPDC020630]|uniref:hypothetical protein n=1 Tax=Embleya sp. NPDC020630 TaxID=3363979 RepID=UPI0037B70871
MRRVDAGSRNGRTIEIGATFGPVCGAERYGLRIVAPRRRAYVLPATGPVTAPALRELDAPGPFP